MIITVGRECGSGGHAIGEALAAHYGIRCYDRHILVSEAKARGMYDELESFFSEKPMTVCCILLLSIIWEKEMQRL